MADPRDAAKGSPIARGAIFFKECRDELHKVVKPTRQETIQATTVTLFIIVLVSVILALFDVIFNRLMMVVLS